MRETLLPLLVVAGFIIFVIVMNNYDEEQTEIKNAEIDTRLEAEVKVEEEKKLACLTPARDYADMAEDWFLEELALVNPNDDHSTYWRDVELISCEEKPTNTYLYYIKYINKTFLVTIKYTPQYFDALQKDSITRIDDEKKN